MKILHISDAHFGTKITSGKSESTHYFINEETGKSNPDVLLNLLKSKFQADEIDIVIDSGDVGWIGSNDDYILAKPLYKGLAKYFKKATFVVIPGNHDVLLTEPDSSKKQNDYVNFLKEIYGKKFSNNFPIFDDIDRHSLVYYKHIKNEALVLGLNSAASIDEYNSQIFISPKILNELSKKIVADNVSDETLRILVVHHHLLPFIEPKWDNTVSVTSIKEKVDTSLIVNSARLQSWLGENRFHLVLHGHKHIFHGREDLLWHDRLYESEQRKLLILGAGSVGVKDDSRRPSPPSFNQIRVYKTQKTEFKFSVTVKAIKEKSTNFVIEDWIKRNHSTATSQAVNYFEAKDVAECHQQITYEVEPNRKISNFVSIVHESTFVLPSTCRIHDQPASIEAIQNSFYTLHPEFDIHNLRNGWKNPKDIRRSFSKRAKNYNIDHGSRLFGANDVVNLVEVENKKIQEYFPVYRAIQNLSSSSTRGYVGLYNFELDVKKDSSALPGLTGIQFVPVEENGIKRLDIVAFFRNIELSFWWVVNCYEMEQLLKYACRKLKNIYVPGRITFFASIAQWSTDQSKVAFKPLIELYTKDKIYELVSKLEASNKSAFEELKKLLEDYLLKLSEININFSMLDELNSMIKGINGKQEIIQKTASKLSSVCELLEDSIEEKNNRFEKVDDSKEIIQEIITLLNQHLQLT